MADKVICRKCRGEIPPADVNVGEGVAFCRACQTLSRLSDIVKESEIPDVDLNLLPRGCQVIDNGVQTIVRASARSFRGAAGALFIVCFWNGIVSVFVLVALAGTIHHIFGSVPTWFPGPSTVGKSGQSITSMPLGMVIFLWIFLTPFITIGLFMIGVLLTSVVGRVEVRFDADAGMVFTGCGPFGWKRRFEVSEVESITLGETTWKQDDETKPVIVIDCGRKIRFGSTLPDERRNWMAGVLRKLLVG